MYRWILGLALVITLMGASLLTAPRPAAANHIALCTVNGSALLPILTAVANSVTAGGGTILCVNSNCFHPGALPYSPFRPNC